MENIQRLGDQETSKRRTIADALEVFRDAAGFDDTDHATVEVGLLNLPSGQTVGLVQIFFRPTAQRAYVVALPAAAALHATDIETGQRDRFDVTRLHRATVASDGHASLTDGTKLRAVEVEIGLPAIPSELDWRIVHWTVEFCRARSRCYQFLRRGLEPPYRWMVPLSLQYLNCSELPNLEVPPLKVIVGYIRKRDWTLKKVSSQKVADALRMFFIRQPVARPRRKTAATI